MEFFLIGLFLGFIGSFYIAAAANEFSLTVKCKKCGSKLLYSNKNVEHWKKLEAEKAGWEARIEEDDLKCKCPNCKEEK